MMKWQLGEHEFDLKPRIPLLEHQPEELESVEGYPVVQTFKNKEGYLVVYLTKSGFHKSHTILENGLGLFSGEQLIRLKSQKYDYLKDLSQEELVNKVIELLKQIENFEKTV